MDGLAFKNKNPTPLMNAVENNLLLVVKLVLEAAHCCLANVSGRCLVTEVFPELAGGVFCSTAPLIWECLWQAQGQGREQRACSDVHGRCM